jgi:hypothetical protein
MPQSTSDPVGQVAPYFQIVNKAGCPLDVSQLKVRYYFTNEATAANPLVYACDYISLGSAAATFVTISPARTGANKYLELSFANGSLAPGATLTVQNRFHDQAYSVQFTQSNDYSYDPSKLAYTTWDHVTAFAGGVLVWGREP